MSSRSSAPTSRASSDPHCAPLHAGTDRLPIDLADARLARAELGADTTINNGSEDALAQVMELTGRSLGADVAIEAVGVARYLRAGGGVDPSPVDMSRTSVRGKSATLHLETLWTRDVTLTTGLVDTRTIPQLMGLVASGRLDPTAFATHHFYLAETMAAYDTFADAGATDALKVVLTGADRDGGSVRSGCRRRGWLTVARIRPPTVAYRAQMRTSCGWNSAKSTVGSFSG